MSDVAEAGPRAALSAERERVFNELETIGIDSGTNDSGFADSGQVTAERGEVDALVGSLRDTLSDIDDALAKIDAGTYGTCEQCGQPIGDARLEAMPAARLCIKCASARR
jgi:RNA polymerase-binding transcription factor DksA